MNNTVPHNTITVRIMPRSATQFKIHEEHLSKGNTLAVELEFGFHDSSIIPTSFTERHKIKRIAMNLCTIKGKNRANYTVKVE